MQETTTLVYDSSEPKSSGFCVTGHKVNSNVFVWSFMEEEMINFEEELKHFQPSDEIEDAEIAIYEHDITDMTDIMQQMMSELKRK